VPLRALLLELVCAHCANITVYNSSCSPAHQQWLTSCRFESNTCSAMLAMHLLPDRPFCDQCTDVLTGMLAAPAIVRCMHVHPQAPSNGGADTTTQFTSRRFPSHYSASDWLCALCKIDA
jgi:hypothetical protein